MNTIHKNKRISPLRLMCFFIVFAIIMLFIAVAGNRIDYFFSDDTYFSANTDTQTVVIIDPGHGGEDGGAVGVNGCFEKDINLDIALKLEEYLISKGIQTVLTRREDILLYDKNSDYHGHKKEQDLATRKNIAQAYENAIFISIHMNSFSDSKYKGLQVYYSPNNDASAALAKGVQDLCRNTLMPENNRKIKKAGSSIYLLHKLFCPAILIECGFLSNKEECALLSNEEYKQKLSSCIADAIIQYLSEES